MACCPDAGDLIWLDFNPQAGREQAGRRPALVLSPAGYNQRARLCVVCPVTGQAKGYPFEVPLPEGGVILGVVLSDQVRSLSWEARNAVVIARAPAVVLAEVRQRAKALLGLD
ncbi:MAG: endoribonuclease MazF [Magnetospirillum sp.]|nr:endoribonuclease MazF [Magnetospirillum sp.]